MNTLHVSPPRLRAAVLVAALLAATHSFAADTDISQVPMSVKNTLSPNIMFTLDDSGSMAWETIPDAGLSHLFPRTKSPYGDDVDYYWITVDADPEDIYARYYRSAAGNSLFYNPAVRYEPWRKADGSSWPDAVPAKASMNPGNSDAPTLDLTANVSGIAKRLYRGDAPSGYVSDTPLTFWPASYFVYTGTEPLSLAGATNVKANFKHIEIKSGQSYDAYPDRTDCGTGACSYTAELQNFANWFSYHRSRVLAARAGIGAAFSQQGENFRIGYATINSPTSTIDGVSTGRVLRGVRPFKGDARLAFFDLLYSGTIITDNDDPAETPLVAAADDIGAYFSRSDAKSPWRKSMTDSGSIELSCFRNYHILMTDGYWTEGFPARSAIDSSNVDNTAGPTHTHASGDKRCLGGGTYTYEPKHPFADGSTGTLADVAMYYWKNDLRSDLANNVPPDIPNDRSDCETKTPKSSNVINPGFWQHLNTFTVGFGVEGTLSEDLIESAFTDKPKDFSWPAPTSSDAAKLDDLAHAAVNGHGNFFTTSDPAAFASELTAMLSRINADTTASAASAVSNPNVTLNDNITYETTYLPGLWTGDLKAFEIDVQTGAPDRTKPVWAVACPTDDDPDKICDGVAGLLDKQTASSRKIVTYDGTAGAAFDAGLGGLDDALIAYLRGDRSCEQGRATATACTTTYRARTHLLGAIIHSEPFLAREPDRGYTDTGYAAFRADKAGRARMLYVGANDGMLHAFSAETGEEEWAYVPKLVVSKLADYASPTAAFQTTVDGYIAVADVDFNNAHTSNSTSADWRTLLVGGLGRGGKGIYALDVTDSTAADEATLAEKVLWEFPNADTPADVVSKLGFSFSRPIIVKHEITKTDGTRAGLGWVVLISSGYNNGGSGDGKGYLFMLDVETGAVLATLSTGEGSSTSPSGLGQVSAWVDNDNLNSAVRWVYGGDLNGNLWRFDLSTETDLDGRSATKLATLTASGGSAQAITIAPELTRIKSEGAYYNLVAVGTGRYLGDSDVPGSDTVSASATQTQSFYVIADPISGSRLITRSGLEQRTLTTLSNGKRALVDPDPLEWSKTSGWYVDLNTSGERVVTDPAIAHTTVVFVSNVPNSNPCLPGTSHLFQFDLVSGSYVIGTTDVSERIGDTLATRPVLIKLPSGKIVALIRKSDGTTVAREVPTPTSGGSIRRLSWRELNYR